MKTSTIKASVNSPEKTRTDRRLTATPAKIARGGARAHGGAVGPLTASWTVSADGRPVCTWSRDAGD
ncbi:MAG: hypothetical protein JO372_14995 [Solirubrobacterales bacterium]|nr:hypothetical protein [Solirubrobacterales bacterium]